MPILYAIWWKFVQYFKIKEVIEEIKAKFQEAEFNFTLLSLISPYLSIMAITLI